ncbi:MAG: hypothetical protein C4292_00105 [Nitrososphaera sp.]
MPSVAASATTGTKLKPGELLRKLESLDIDEGIRIESGKRGRKDKLFVNRRPSGTFVVQHDDNTDDFGYFESARQVIAMLKREKKNSYAAYAY